MSSRRIQNEGSTYTNPHIHAYTRTHTLTNSQGWVECVGCADRSCYDLKCHMTGAKVDMSAKETLPEPVSLSLLVRCLRFRWCDIQVSMELEHEDVETCLHFREYLQCMYVAPFLD